VSVCESLTLDDKLTRYPGGKRHF